MKRNKREYTLIFFPFLEHVLIRLDDFWYYMNKSWHDPCIYMTICIAKMYILQTWEEDQIGILSKFLRNFNNLFDNGFIRHYIIFKIISLFQKVSLLHGTDETTAENGSSNG